MVKRLLESEPSKENDQEQLKKYEQELDEHKIGDIYKNGTLLEGENRTLLGNKDIPASYWKLNENQNDIQESQINQGAPNLGQGHQVSLHERIDASINWTQLDYKQPRQYLSVDGGVSNREVVEVTLNDAQLNSAYGSFRKTITQQTPESIVDAVFKFVTATLPTKKILDESEFSDFYLYNKKVKKASLSQFVEKGEGLCRHHALLTAYLLGRAFQYYINTDEIKNPSVILHRGTADNLKAHTWVVLGYNQVDSSSNKTSHHQLLIDTTNSELKFYDLTTQEGKDAAEVHYKTRGLHGILRREKLSPLMDKISEEVRNYIYEKEDKTEEGQKSITDEAIEKDLVCPITREIYLEPVTLLFTDENGIIHKNVYEKSAITDWLVNRRKSSDPKTGLNILNNTYTLIPASQTKITIDEKNIIDNPSHIKLKKVFKFLNRRITQPEDTNGEIKLDEVALQNTNIRFEKSKENGQKTGLLKSLINEVKWPVNEKRSEEFFKKGSTISLRDKFQNATNLKEMETLALEVDKSSQILDQSVYDFFELILKSKDITFEELEQKAEQFKLSNKGQVQQQFEAMKRAYQTAQGFPDDVSWELLATNMQELENVLSADYQNRKLSKSPMKATLVSNLGKSLERYVDAKKNNDPER